MKTTRISLSALAAAILVAGTTAFAQSGSTGGTGTAGTSGTGDGSYSAGNTTTTRTERREEPNNLGWLGLLGLAGLAGLLKKPKREVVHQTDVRTMPPPLDPTVRTNTPTR